MSTSRVSREEKEEKLKQKGHVIWFTGLPSSGKTTLAIALERKLLENGKTAIILDGDEQRKGLNSNLGFSVNDRFENIRRLAETAKILKNAGIIVLVSVIAPLVNMRKLAKEIVGIEDFSLVYVDASLEVSEKRDVKGMYKKTRNGEIFGFTGIDSEFQIPEDFELMVATEKLSIKNAVNKILGLFK